MRSQEISRKYSAFLMEMGYKVKVLDDPKMAVAMGKNFLPDLILCERQLPVISGLQVASMFKEMESFGNKPFVLIANKKSSLSRGFGKRISAMVDDVIAFPFDQMALYGTVTKWLESDERPKGSEALHIMGGAGANSATDHKVKNNINSKAQKEEKPSLPPATSLASKDKFWGKGKVSPFSISRLLYNLIRKNETGVIMVRGDKWMKVFIDSGKVTDVTSCYIPQDTFGRFLIRQKKISTLENEVTIKRAKEKNQLQGQVLVQLKILDKKELDFYLTHHKSTKFLRLFQSCWGNASFKFVNSKHAPKSVDMKPVSLKQVLNMGVMKAANPHDLYGYFKKCHSENRPIKLSGDFSKAIKHLGLKKEEAAAARALDSKSISQLMNETDDDFKRKIRLAFLMLNTQGADFDQEKVKGQIIAEEGIRKAFDRNKSGNKYNDNYQYIQKPLPKQTFSYT